MAALSPDAKPVECGVYSIRNAQSGQYLSFTLGAHGGNVSEDDHAVMLPEALSKARFVLPFDPISSSFQILSKDGPASRCLSANCGTRHVCVSACHTEETHWWKLELHRPLDRALPHAGSQMPQEPAKNEHTSASLLKVRRQSLARLHHDYAQVRGPALSQSEPEPCCLRCSLLVSGGSCTGLRPTTPWRSCCDQL